MNSFIFLTSLLSLTGAQVRFTPFQKRFSDTILPPFNQLLPPHEATLSFEHTPCCSHGERILAESTLFPPNKVSWPDDGGLYTVFILDVSIQNNHSAVQWAVANIKGNDIGRGDKFMEYVTAIAWRNCFNGEDNHGGRCSGEGIIFDPAYVHQNVMYVFKQEKGRITVEEGERNKGCQLNLQSTMSNLGTWEYDNVTAFIDKYNLKLHAATWYEMPYSPMVGAVLCRYHECYGNTLSAFLAPNYPNTTVSLVGVTDLPKCGKKTTYRQRSSHPLSVDNGDRNPIDWSQLYCSGCTARRTASKSNRRAGVTGYDGVRLESRRPRIEDN